MDEIKTYVLDRIEGTVAVLLTMDGHSTLEIPAADLPCGCREGSVLRLCRGDWMPDMAAETERRNSMQNRLEKLLQKK